MFYRLEIWWLFLSNVVNQITLKSSMRSCRLLHYAWCRMLLSHLEVAITQISIKRLSNEYIRNHGLSQKCRNRDHDLSVPCGRSHCRPTFIFMLSLCACRCFIFFVVFNLTTGSSSDFRFREFTFSQFNASPHAYLTS